MESRAHHDREFSPRGKSDLDIILRKYKSPMNGSATTMLRRALAQGQVPHACVVGAGMAGLRCAAVLSEHGFKVTILEGRNRIGGRVQQISQAGHTYDLGPNWIHGTDHNPILELAKEAKATTFTMPDTPPSLFDQSGHAVDANITKEHYDIMWGIISDAFKLSKTGSASIPSELSLMDFFNQKVKKLQLNETSSKLVLALARMWGDFVGEPIEKQSLKFFWLEECIEGENLLMASTYETVLAKVAASGLANAELHLSTKAVAFTTDTTGGQAKAIRVNTASGEVFDFDEIVVTCPLGWLKRNIQFFIPALPTRILKAVEHISYGRLEKVYLTFPKAFWSPAGKTQPFFANFLSPTYTDQNPKQWTVECVRLDSLPGTCAHPTLLFYTHGPCAEYVTSMINGVDTNCGDYYARLDNFFHPYYSRLPGYSAASLECKPSNIIATNWQNDELSGWGSYCTFQTSNASENAQLDCDIEALREGCPERRIWFAGEHTAPFVALGTTTGAYWSGQSVAHRIAEAYELFETSLQMLWFPTFSAVFLVAFFNVVFSQKICPAPAAYELPIKNTSLAEHAVRRGVTASVGSPGQALAFQLSWYDVCLVITVRALMTGASELNNTYLFDNKTQSNLGGCNDGATAECTAQLGGLFDEGSSSTWSRATDISALSTASENPLINPNHTADIWGTDVLSVTLGKNLPHFPFGISRGQGETMNSLGLGRNSTLLNALVDSGMIAAKSWGYWQGWTGAKQQYQIDGNLVLGGYDSDKITGPNITLPTSAADNLDTDCYLATVTDIKMNLKNGSSPSLFGSNRATVGRACVEPHFQVLSLTQEMWESFLAISGSTYVGRSDSVVAFYGMLIEADGAYDGDLTISIDPGLDITIPNHQLVVPNYDINASGQLYAKNQSTREVLINSLQQINANDKLVLGLPFFTSAYMMVDNDREQFTLWKSQASKTSQLVAMPALNCKNVTSPTSPGPPPAVSSAVNTATDHKLVSNGAIAGAVVGALAGGMLLVSAAFLIWKRRTAQTPAEEPEKSTTTSRPTTPILYKPELASDRQPPQEMPVTRDPETASAPYEMSEERARQELPARGAHEMPGVALSRLQHELPGLPSSPKSTKSVSRRKFG
ncbi:hypothetical protein ACLMJK_006855 [Lecanora helva]